MAADRALSPSSGGAPARVVDAEGYLREAAALVECYLDRVLPAPGGHIPRLAEAVRYSALGGGKRLRPALALGAAEACGGARDVALPVAAAVEMIHTYSLIHDDLPAMDDDFRRGRPTSHKVFGEALAILAGDALLTQAFEVLAADGAVPPERRTAIVREVAAAGGPAGLVGGQVADLEGEGRDLTLPELEFIHARKTGALILASVRGGAIAAGASAARLGALSEYARRTGLCFQIVDDLLDVEGDPAATGKGTGRDSTKRKATFPAIFGIDASRQRAAELVEEALAAIADFGPEADPLRALARFVGRRDR
ncbi:MAG TPA: farnesyl diphosphate synthase [bacterium]